MTLIVLLFMAVLSGCTDWPVFGFDSGGTSANSAETTISASSVSRVHQVWQRPPDAGALYRAQPIAAGGLLFTSEDVFRTTNHDGRLLALDEATGAIKWSRTYPRNVFPLGVVDGKLIVDLGRMYTTVAGQPPFSTLAALSASSGAPLWAVTASHDVADFGRVAFGGGRMYVYGGDGLTARDPATGRALWSCPLLKLCPVDPAYGFVYGNNRLFLSGRLESAGGVIDAATGRTLAVHHAAQPALFWSTPVVAAGKVIRTGDLGNNSPDPDAEVAAWNASCTGTCEPVWRTMIDDNVVQPPTVTPTRTFVAGARALYVFDTATGRRLWSGNPGFGDPRDLLVAGDLVYLHGLKQIAVFRASGCGTATCRPVRVLPSLEDGARAIVVNGRIFDSSLLGLRALAP
jgi:outer membrane protein assembly factor BamB